MTVRGPPKARRKGTSMGLDGPRRLFVVLVGGLLLVSSPGGVVAGPPIGSTGGIIPADHRSPAQGVWWKQAKERHLLVRDGSGAVTLRAPTTILRSVAADAPTHLKLPTAVTSRIIEPEGHGLDDSSPRRSYDDRNYWNFCAPGAATVAAYYFGGGPMAMVGTFHEPYGPKVVSTHWHEADTDANGYKANARAYILYMAEAVQPPTFPRPGIDNFDEYPTRGGSVEIRP